MIICIMTTFISCTGEGDDVSSVSLLVDPFDSIVLDEIFEVIIQSGELYGITLEAPTDLLSKVELEQTGKKITLTHFGFGNWSHPKRPLPRLFISSPSWKYLDAIQTCRIESLETIRTDSFTLVLGSKLNIADLDLDCQHFKFYTSGPTGGRVTLTGSSDLVEIYNGALMEVDASELLSQFATVENESRADVYVYVTHRLDYSIRGIGNIYVTGDPDEIVPGEILSKGRLFPF